MFWNVLLAGSPILAGLLFPLQGDAPRMGERNCWFHCLARSNHQPTRAPAPHKSQHCCFASASGREGYASLLLLVQTTWDIFSQTPNTAQLAPRPNSLCFHTWKTDFESSKPCLPTLILTSSPLRRTQLAESNTVFASNSKNL